MNRPLTALFAALEALLAVGLGIGIPLVPLTLLWALQYGLQIDWVVFWRASVDIWLLGNGADLRVTLDPVTASSLGFPGSASPFLLSIAPLGFALLTLLLGLRAGRRIGETPYRRLGMLTAVAAFGVLALAATLSALHPLARPSIWQGTLLPTLVFALGVVIGARLGQRRRNQEVPEFAGGLLDNWIGGWPRQLRKGVTSALRGGAAAAALVVAVAASIVAVLLVLSYAQIIALYESAHAGVLGGIALTLAQLAFVPNLVIWAASWLIGPGFAIGTGSAVSPLGTSLGPLPAVPILGALPTGDLSLGFLGLLVPVLAGFLAGVLVRPRVLGGLEHLPRGRWLLATGLGLGIVGGGLLGLLAWFSAGAAGPGRLVDVGPSPWLVGFYAVLEIGVAAIIGLLSASSKGASGGLPEGLPGGGRRRPE
ncbi:MAG: cell division protein PerM [Lacisediminihabitans sp.]